MMKIAQRAQRIEPFYVMEVAKAAAERAALVAHTDAPMIFLNIGEPDFTAPPLVKAAAERGKWIDQSQSLNIFYSGTSGKVLSEIYQYAWLLGLKTTYYLRTISWAFIYLTV